MAFNFNATPKSPPRPPTNLADGVTGIVAFPSRDGASFRFEIVAKDDELYIWLEDRSTKKQWRTTQLALGDFVKEDSAIPQAAFNDYATCFLNCLEANSTSEEFSRDLLVPKHDSAAFELKLTLRIRVFASVWTPTYSFPLQPVPLTAVDLLAAKVRDQREHIRRLEQQLKTGLTPSNVFAGSNTQPFYVRGDITSQVKANQTIPWRVVGFAHTSLLEVKTTGAMRFVVGGTFVVNVMVQHNNTNNTTTVELLVDGNVVVSCVDSSASGHNRTSAICHVVVMRRDGELSVVYRGNNTAQPGSYIVVHQLR